MLMSTSVLPVPLNVCSNLNTSEYDSIVVIGATRDELNCFKELAEPLDALFTVDKHAIESVFVVPSSLPSKKIVFSSVGPINRDFDDVRRFEDAAEKGVLRALQSGSVSPMLFLGQTTSFPETEVVSLLGALKALYVPLEVRELPPGKVKATKLGLFCSTDKIRREKYENFISRAMAIESGRIVCRDIGGSDPERMAPPRVEEYIKEVFKDVPGVNIEVESGHHLFKKEYPCFAAVDRAASGVERHSGRIIWLTYSNPDAPVEETAMLVGKGVTYDTGGADIKAGGIMAGMSRDKCGAASVAGFIKAVSILQPSGLKVIGAMAMVRNSVGSNCYVSDEIVVSRSGVRLRVGNTDAEGRMAMVDVLCRVKEIALEGEINPHLMTIATLTGHACLAMGCYTAIMDNGLAKMQNCAQKIQQFGEDMADPFEISSVRREDFDFCKDKSGEFVDVLQCNNNSSSRTPRGHQFPAAFLTIVSGLDKHMKSSDRPLKYSHLDIAGSSGELPNPTTASTVPALTAYFAFSRCNFKP